MRYYISPVVRNVWDELKRFCDRKVDPDTTRDANVKPLPKPVKYIYYTILRFFEDFFFPLNRLESKPAAKIPTTPAVDNAKAVPEAEAATSPEKA